MENKHPLLIALEVELQAAQKELDGCKSFLRMNAQYYDEYAGRIECRKQAIARMTLAIKEYESSIG